MRNPMEKSGQLQELTQPYTTRFRDSWYINLHIQQWVSSHVRIWEIQKQKQGRELQAATEVGKTCRLKVRLVLIMKNTTLSEQQRVLPEIKEGVHSFVMKLIPNCWSWGQNSPLDDLGQNSPLDDLEQKLMENENFPKVLVHCCSFEG